MEELIVSGRMNPKIDPNLNIWHWEIPVDLFAAALAAGVLFFAGLYYLRGKEDTFPSAVKITPLIAPILLVICLITLFLDLSHKPYFWRLYTTIRLESPMSWGSWTYMVIVPVSFLWAGLYVKSRFTNWKWPFAFLDTFFNYFENKKSILAWIMVIFSLILGVYTGILLSAFNARPLWNSSIMGPLFLSSGLAGGASLIYLFANDPAEKKTFRAIMLAFLGIQLFFIIHMFMGFRASTQVQIDASQLLLGGSYTLPFWIGVVFIGLILPIMLEILEIKGRFIKSYVPVVLILFGSLLLRFIIVYAGQASRYLY